MRIVIGPCPSNKNIWLMFIVVVVRSFGQGIQQPAVSAMIPQIVPTESLQRFNGIQSSIQSLNMFVAPMAAGGLLSLLSIEYIFFLDVATAAIGISIVLIFVKVSSISHTKDVKQGIKAYFLELREGLRYINSKTWLKLIIIYSAFFSFFASPTTLLTPLQVARTFGGDVWRLTAVEIVFSIGMVAGGILISVWGGFKNKAHTIALACALFGLTGFLLGVVPNFEVYLGVMLVCGVTMPLFNTPGMTFRRPRDARPDRDRGRSQRGAGPSGLLPRRFVDFASINFAPVRGASGACSDGRRRPE
jgi:DHA3 family macrolide efflux protein-like MFS transporter